jgi:hypothetical protein
MGTKNGKNQEPNPNEVDQEHDRKEEQPERADLKTPEGPGGRDAAKGRDDALDEATRRGER